MSVSKRPPRKDNSLTFSTKHEAVDKLEVFKFEGSQQLQQSTDQGATRINEQETQHDRDSRWAPSCKLPFNRRKEGMKSIFALCLATGPGRELDYFLRTLQGEERSSAETSHRGSGCWW